MTEQRPATTPTIRQSIKDVGSGNGDKKIRSVSKFEEDYKLGKEVMPSTHSYMKVHFATRKKDGCECVVKVRIKPDCFRSRQAERNWKHHTELLLNMPVNGCIAALYEVLEDPKAFYVVMEKVTGVDLFEALDKEGRFSPQATAEILRQLLSATSHLHSFNALHKDLKLENVMITTPAAVRPNSGGIPPNCIKVVDFDTLEQWSPTAPLAQDVVGTDQYIAQEAYAGQYSALSDVFAVGVMAYKMLTGKFPFHDDTFDDDPGDNWVGGPKMVQIQRRLMMAKTDYKAAVFKECPQAADLIARMLAFDERQRPTVNVALEHTWLKRVEEAERPNEPKEQKQKPSRKSATHDADQFVPSVAPWRNEDILDDGIVVVCEPTTSKRTSTMR